MDGYWFGENNGLLTTGMSLRLPSDSAAFNLLAVRVAFKEWAVVVDALGRGEQIIILRKGGIHEGQGGFKIEHPQFVLFPTLFHQQRESVVSAAQARFDQIARTFPPKNRVRLGFFANVVEWRRIDSLATAERLRGQHIWRDEVIAERFDWGKDKAVFALAVRVLRLAEAVELPMRDSYGGCKSWLELEQEVADVADLIKHLRGNDAPSEQEQQTV